MKQLLILLILLTAIASCNGQQIKRAKDGLEIATIKDMSTHIGMNAYQRKRTGYDSIQLLVDSGKITANFCYPNAWFFQRDTVFTADTTYRLWGLKIPVFPNVFLVTGGNKGWTQIREGNFGYYDSIGKPGWYLPSIIVDSFKTTMTKVKP